MKLAVNFSEALLELFDEDLGLPVDYIKVPTRPFPDSFSQFEQGRIFRRLLPHPAQPGVLSLGHPSPGERFNRDIVAKIVELTAPPYLSTHLEANVDFFPLFKHEQHHFNQELAREMLERFQSGIELVKRETGLPLLIENFPYYSWWRHYKLGSDPSFITEVCEAGDCGFLLDIAHARCSAWYFGIPVEQYLDKLPLHRLVEIHLAGTSMRVEGLRDTHTKLTAVDFQLFEFILEKATPEIVTIEYGGLPDRIVNLAAQYEPIRRNEPRELKEMIYRVAELVKVNFK
ncbi:MAG: DUF692 family protein [Firmicutes bacterium]|nr:DUF692 family protein [Bacillota bacterium]